MDVRNAATALETAAGRIDARARRTLGGADSTQAEQDRFGAGLTTDTPKAVETEAERINLVYGAKVDLAQGWSARLVPGQPAEVIVNVAAPDAPATARR